MTLKFPAIRLVQFTLILAIGMYTMFGTDTTSEAQQSDVNYDEAKVPKYELPPLLRSTSGLEVSTAEQWEKSRRPEVLDLLAEYAFGRTPDGQLDHVKFEVLESDDQALNGNATRKQIRIHFGNAATDTFDMLIYIPHSKSPAPVFVGLNFEGNHTVHNDPAIKLGGKWKRTTDGSSGDMFEQADESTRGKMAHRWEVELLIKHGYAVATAHYNEIAPDDVNLAFAHGVATVFGEMSEKTRAADAWGTIGIWSWGLSRMLDYLQQEPLVNAKQAAVVGHSRLGKTALWAGAVDPRFAIVISNNSGCGGAALFRRQFGEQVHHMAKNFPHWFCRNYSQYANREDEMPIDAHMLIAVIAPRPVYVASASEDRWADPHGEFLAAKAAEPVYALYGKAGIPTDQWPIPDKALYGSVGYHLRTGPHDILAFDWQQYIQFADHHFGRSATAK